MSTGRGQEFADEAEARAVRDAVVFKQRVFSLSMTGVAEDLARSLDAFDRGVLPLDAVDECAQSLRDLREVQAEALENDASVLERVEEFLRSGEQV